MRIVTFASCDKDSDKTMTPEGNTNQIPCLTILLVPSEEPGWRAAGGHCAFLYVSVCAINSLWCVSGDSGALLISCPLGTLALPAFVRVTSGTSSTSAPFRSDGAITWHRISSVSSQVFPKATTESKIRKLEKYYSQLPFSQLQSSSGSQPAQSLRPLSCFRTKTSNPFSVHVQFFPMQAPQAVTPWLFLWVCVVGCC